MNKSGYTINYVLVWVALLMLGACIEPFEPEIDKYENVLVVDGLITDKKEVYTIELSRTMRFEDKIPRMEIGALVEVADNLGNLYSFREIDDGIYVSDTSEFVGIPGRSYQLMIQTYEGKTYSSTLDLMKDAPEIESVFWEYKEERLIDNELLQGIQILLDTRDDQNDTRYYRWEWEEEWAFRVPYVKLGYESREFCWASAKSDRIVVANTTQLSSDVVNDQLIYFVNNRSNRLLNTYSTLIRQYALTESSYSFWRNLKLLNENSGSLFDPAPAAVFGNIFNVNDDSEPVIGYFQVSGVSEKRIFVSNDELPSLFRAPTDYEFCQIVDVPGPGESYIHDGWIIMLRYEELGMERTMLINYAACYDCTARGSNKKPDYWIDYD